MADYTAFVDAGETLVRLLREQMTPEPLSKPELISLCSPHESENNQLTVYLFHMEEDQYNNQVGYYQESQTLERARPTQFHISFLITAHSKAPTHLKEADQYRIIGAAMQALKDYPVLPKRCLSGSLKESGAELHLTVERPNFEQMLKIWNNTSNPYKISFVCKLAGIALDSKRSRSVTRVTEVEIGFDQRDTRRREESGA